MLIEKPIWLRSTPEQKAVLITIMCLANHKENEWEWKGEKFNVLPGQFVTSLESIRLKTGLGISIQNVRSSLSRFKKLQFLTYESTKMGRVISICNWGEYQPEEKVAQQRTQQRGNKGATTNKNDKNDKKVLISAKGKRLEGKRLEAFLLFWDAFGYKKGKAQAIGAWLNIPELTDRLVKDIVKSAQRENRKRSGVVSNGQTPIYAQGWITGRRWEDEDAEPREFIPKAQRIQTAEEIRKDNETN